MAYVFDPINNTLIDDEDKSLGNKLALNDDEFQKLLDIPGVFRASEAPQPPQKPDVQEIEAINRFMRDNKAEGGRIGGGVIAGKNFGDRTGFANPVSPLSSPEVLKRIIELANNNKLGAEAIANVLTEELGFKVSRAPVGKQITKLKTQGLIKEIPVSEKAASIAMRGDLYGQPAGEKYLKIRDIRDVDKKAIDLSTGKLKYNIPEKAKFKINFGNTGAKFADVTNIPEEFIGVKYFENKKAAEKALAKRKKLKLIGDVDPDPIRRSANKKKYDLIKEVSNNNIEDVLAKFKKGEPLEKAHRLSLNQVKKTGEMYNVMNLGLDFDDPSYVQINNKLVKPYENKLKQLYTEQNNLYKKAKNLKVIPKDLQQKIQFNNKKISTVVDLSGGRVQGLQLDEFNLKPKTYGVNYANVFGFGLYDKSVKQLTKQDRETIGAIMQYQVDNEKKTAGKTAKKLFENKKFLKNIDVLATTGKILKTAGKVIKPLSYAMGPYAVFSAQNKAEAAGIDLNLMDKIKAFDAGDADVAIDSYKRRTDPEFAAAERAKDLAKMSDDFEEVGLDEVKPDETLQDFMANGGRAGFNGGGAAGADVDFATQLEYFLTNEDAELPQLSTYKETKNPIEVFNNIIDPRNYPYYADVLARAGVRIGEFGARVLPATGKLISDTIQKGPFKIKETGNNYVQDYTDVLPSNIKGTGIFSEFLENITSTSLEKKIGLASLIEKEEQKQIDRGSTAGPKVFADTIGLGAEVTAPIFPGLKLLRAYAKSKNLPADNVTKEILVKEIDEVLETQGMNRREFLQTTGAGATVILAKMLGFGDEVAQTAKVVEKAAAAPAGVPPYFFDLVEIIKKKGIDATKKSATQDLMNVYKYKGYEVYEDLATGQIRIEKGSSIRTDDDALQVLEYKPGQADETTKGKPADDYEEVTQVKYGDPTDIDVPIEEIEDGVDLDSILEFIKNEKVN